MESLNVYVTDTDDPCILGVCRMCDLEIRSMKLTGRGKSVLMCNVKHQRLDTPDPQPYRIREKDPMKYVEVCIRDP